MKRNIETVRRELEEIEDLARAKRNACCAGTQTRDIFALLTSLAKIVREDIVQ